MNPPHIRDTKIITPRGQLFARIWAPTAAASERLNDVNDQNRAFVLLHDSLGSVELWREFPALLAQNLQAPVVAYDRLGYGHSDPAVGLPPADFVSREAQEGLAPLLQQLGIGSAVLVGHSVGGGMAVNAAMQMPERIQGIVTIAAQAFPEDRTLKAIAEAKLQFQDDAQLSRLQRYHGPKARWVVDAWTDSWLSPAFASWHVRDVLPHVRCPLLALHGEHDEYGTAVHPQIYSQLSGGPARMQLMPDTYHLPHREKPQAVVEEIAAFVREHGLQL